MATTNSYDGSHLPPTSQSAQQPHAQASVPVRRKTATRSTQPSGPNIGAQVSLNAGEQSYSVLNML